MENNSDWLSSLAKKVPQHITGSVIIGSLFIMYSPSILANLSENFHSWYLMIFGVVSFCSIIPISLNAIVWFKERDYLMKAGKIRVEDAQSDQDEEAEVAGHIEEAVNTMEGEDG